MYESSEKVYHDTEGMSYDKYQYGKQDTDIGSTNYKFGKQVDNHADCRGTESQGQEAAIAKNVPKVASYIVKAEYAGEDFACDACFFSSLSGYKDESSQCGDYLRRKNCA